MRAIVITRPGGPEVLEERDVATPMPGAFCIRVRVHATALNRADILQRRGRYPAPPGAPEDIPGLEYAGEVEAVGAGVRAWREGDRVMGLVGGGGYAEHVVVHEREALPVPANLSLEEAAAVPEVFITAHDALFARLQLELGERLLIHAVGSGVGTAALQLARAAGASVYGSSRSAWKLERAAELGLDLAVDATTEDWADLVERHTFGAGVHAILDLVGADYLAANLRILAPRGRMVLVGLMGGTSTAIDLGTALRKRLTIIGTTLRARPLEEKIAAAQLCARHVLPLLADGRVCAQVDRTYPMSDVREAHRAMEANENFGKIVLRWD